MASLTCPTSISVDAGTNQRRTREDLAEPEQLNGSVDAGSEWEVEGGTPAPTSQVISVLFRDLGNVQSVFVPQEVSEKHHQPRNFRQ